MTSEMHDADRIAFEKMAGVSPAWDGVETAADALGLDDNVLLHAGPPFESPASVSMPILNSACVAAVFQGLAGDFERAEAMIRAGEILLRPAQDHACVTPLAAVVSASMPLHRVSDGSITVYAPLNGGMRPAMRLGLRSESVLEHIRWLNGPWADFLDAGLAGPLDLVSIAAEALRQGDDCHGRTPVGTRLLMERFEAGLVNADIDENTRDFMDNSPPLFLNLWMAASKFLMLGAAGVPGSGLVTAAAGNGVETGIQVSGLPGRWFQAPATPPRGRFDVDLPKERALPAIGDSAVVETLGLGAMALQLSPEQERNFGDFLPPDYRKRPASLMCGRHPGFGELDCPLGLSARAAADYGQGPIIGLGILDIEGEKGRLGGGIYDMPSTLFESAVAALEV